MENFVDIKDFEFISEDQYSKLSENLIGPCLVRMRIYNDVNYSKLESTVYIKIQYNKLDKIKACLEEIRNTHYASKSFFTVDIWIKQ